MISSGDILAFWFLSAFACGFLAGYVADEKGRSGILWMFIGWLCGILALIAVVGLPEKQRVIKLRPRTFSPPEQKQDFPIVNGVIDNRNQK